MTTSKSNRGSNSSSSSFSAIEEVKLLPWYRVGFLPYGAADGEQLKERKLLEDCVVQVTQVTSFDCIWLCPEPWQPRYDLLKDMNNFYTSGEGKRWRVPDTRFCSPGQLLAAKYSEIGYHRILVKNIINYEKVSVLYVDYGTIMEIHASDLRLLHKKFLTLPAQAVKARLFGVKELKGDSSRSREVLTNLVSDFNSHGMFCIIIKPGIGKEVPPLVKVVEFFSETSIENKLLHQNCADINFSQLAALMKIEVPDVEVVNNDKIVVCMKLHEALKNLMQSLLLSRVSRGHCSASVIDVETPLVIGAKKINASASSKDPQLPPLSDISSVDEISSSSGNDGGKVCYAPQIVDAEDDSDDEDIISRVGKVYVKSYRPKLLFKMTQKTLVDCNKDILEVVKESKKIIKEDSVESFNEESVDSNLEITDKDSYQDIEDESTSSW